MALSSLCYDCKCRLIFKYHYSLGFKKIGSMTAPVPSGKYVGEVTLSTEIFILKKIL